MWNAKPRPRFTDYPISQEDGWLLCCKFLQCFDIFYELYSFFMTINWFCGFTNPYRTMFSWMLSHLSNTVPSQRRQAMHFTSSATPRVRSRLMFSTVLSIVLFSFYFPLRNLFATDWWKLSLIRVTNSDQSKRTKAQFGWCFWAEEWDCQSSGRWARKGNCVKGQ